MTKQENRMTLQTRESLSIPIISQSEITELKEWVWAVSMRKLAESCLQIVHSQKQIRGNPASRENLTLQNCQ